ANDPQVRELAAQLEVAAQPTVGPPRATDTVTARLSPVDLSRLQTRLTEELSAGMAAHNFIRYILVNKELRVLAATSPESLGRTIPEYEDFLSRAIAGQVTVSTPFPSDVVLADERGRRRTGVDR